MDLLTEDEDGEYTYERDVSIGYPRMEEFCIQIDIFKVSEFKKPK
jgi:hypothetical protein